MKGTEDGRRGTGDGRQKAEAQGSGGAEELKAGGRKQKAEDSERGNN